uniref:Uncharacterized protein n=1 Tax=uncultured Desulfobacterium sp. TaxID=201089 RepID=E1Y8M4_9BACT|nr:unknown protein [uncultured Desulfobacterium sp.]
MFKNRKNYLWDKTTLRSNFNFIGSKIYTMSIFNYCRIINSFEDDL